MVIIPEYLLRRRHYPLHIYISAINEYCTDPNKTQRKAAEETRKRFGLATFAHTTLGRTLKALCKIISEAGKALSVADGAEGGDECTEKSVPGEIAARREHARRFISIWLHGAGKRGFESACHAMARRIWIVFQKLLI